MDFLLIVIESAYELDSLCYFLIMYACQNLLFHYSSVLVRTFLILEVARCLCVLMPQNLGHILFEAAAMRRNRKTMSNCFVCGYFFENDIER